MQRRALVATALTSTALASGPVRQVRATAGAPGWYIGSADYHATALALAEEWAGRSLPNVQGSVYETLLSDYQFGISLSSEPSPRASAGLWDFVMVWAVDQATSGSPLFVLDVADLAHIPQRWVDAISQGYLMNPINLAVPLLQATEADRAAADPAYIPRAIVRPSFR